MWVPDIGELLFSCSRPSYSPPNQRCRWFVVYGGYAAFDTSPPAIIVVAKADFPIVAHHPVKLKTQAPSCHSAGRIGKPLCGDAEGCRFRRKATNSRKAKFKKGETL